MDVRLRLVREIVVDDVRDAIHVDAPAGDVGRDQDGDLVGGEVSQSALAGSLTLVAVDRFGTDAARVQMLHDAVGAVLGAGEDERAIHLQIDCTRCASRAGLSRFSTK